MCNEYFRDCLKIKDCVVRHKFDYCFIQIRKASWPTNVHFEWYPLGICNYSAPLFKCTYCEYDEKLCVKKS